MRALVSIAVLLALLTGSAFPVAAVSSFVASYDLFRGSFRLGTMQRRLDIGSDNSYRFESWLRPRGLVSLFADAEVLEISSGRIVDGRFVPEHYRYDRDGSRKDYELRFDHADNTVRRADPGQSWSATIPPDILDKLSYQAQLMLDIGAAPANLDYTVADRNKLKHYRIENLGTEIVQTGLGRYEAVKLERSRAGSKRRTVVWCAQALGWMPVRVEHRDKHGQVTIAVLEDLTPVPAP